MIGLAEHMLVRETVGEIRLAVQSSLQRGGRGGGAERGY